MFHDLRHRIRVYWPDDRVSEPGGTPCVVDFDKRADVWLPRLYIYDLQKQV